MPDPRWIDAAEADALVAAGRAAILDLREGYRRASAPSRRGAPFPLGALLADPRGAPTVEVIIAMDEDRALARFAAEFLALHGRVAVALAFERSPEDAQAYTAAPERSEPTGGHEEKG